MKKEIELYRYIKWDDYNKSILTKNELSFYSAKKWENDGEFDFELQFSENEKVQLIAYYKVNSERLRISNPDAYDRFIRKNTNDLSPLLKYLDHFLLNHACENRAQQILSNKEEAKNVFKNILFNNYHIVCLSKTHKSYDLWKFKRKAYGDNIICLKLNYNLILNQLLKSPHIKSQHITYQNTPPTWPFDLIYNNDLKKIENKIYDIIFSLNQKLNTEDEFRIVLLNHDMNTPNSFTFDNQLVEKVIINKDADPEVLVEVQKYCSNIEFATINHEDKYVEITN